jgi:Flp pilus assembly protein TadG
MLPPLIQRPAYRSRNRRERGVTLALVALAIFSIIAMAGLSIDVGTLYEASAEAQRTADAAALAAARTISVSGLTGDPNGASDGSWAAICNGASSAASLAAIAVAQQNTVGGTPAASITVTYSAGNGAVPGNANCSSAGAEFAVNPVATVQVRQSSLPTYFSRIWGRTGSSVSATASAEAFNPSGSSTYAPGGEVVPVQPRCVKPWMVPNIDPTHSPTPCQSKANNGNGCTYFVDPTSGSITTQGVPATTLSVIGETFWLIADCRHFGGGPCTLRSSPPEANAPLGAHNPAPTNLDYLPAQASFASTAIPTSGEACSAVSGNYAQAIAGCDQSTQYQCGKTGGNVVDLSENPGLGDTTNGAQCLIHQGTASSDTLTSLGQDMLQPFPPTPPTYPFQIQAGTSSLLGVSPALVTSSTSIASLPIYDSNTVTSFPGGTTTVTVIGFLQVFINYVDGNGNVNVTVMNVAGCGNAAPGTALTGTSPVPIRLITPP